MDRDYKSLEFSNIKAEASGRVRTGIAAVFGNVDAVGDRILPGAFIRTITGGASRAKHLWNHSYQHPPTASIKELRELSRNELPAEVLAKAPEATGGLLVKREYYDGELSNWILKAIDAGDINEMSFAYDIVRSATVTEPISGESEKTREIRELQELKLFDTSDVLWGCNFATVADGAKNLLQTMPLGAIASQFLMQVEAIKAGRRNSDSDQKLIDLIHSSCVGLGAKCGTEDADAGKAASDDSKTGTAVKSTPLSSDWLRLGEFELADLLSN